MDLADLTLKEASEGLRKQRFSSKELTLSCLRRIDRYEDLINAFITVSAPQALAVANKADLLFSKDTVRSPLQGIPGTLKDLFVTTGLRTTSGSKILNNFIPPYTATAVKKLENAGFVCLGKTNMDEFSQGSSTENSAYGPTKNPYALDRVPGGSSGGSAAATALGMGLFSLAEDTGGSIRQPASFCNLFGLKPTYGRVSRYGVIAYGSSLDCPGPLARSTEDLAIIMNHIAGYDPLDSTSSRRPVPDYTKSLLGDIRGLKVGLPREYFADGISPEVKVAVLKAVAVLESLGAKVDELSLPHTKYAVAAYYITVKSEVSSNLARYDGIRYGVPAASAKNIEEQYFRTRGEGFGDEVKRGIMLGTYALSSGYYGRYYEKAQRVRRILRDEMIKAFERFDVLVTPVSPFPPFKIGEKKESPLEMYLADVYTVTVNPSGIPALAVPAGFSKKGLPIGMQILGPQFGEDLLLRVGYTYEQVTDWHKKRPRLELVRSNEH